jgi:hypothetical protein
MSTSGKKVRASCLKPNMEHMEELKSNKSVERDRAYIAAF